MSTRERLNHTIEDGRQALAGLATPEALRELDQRGLSLPSYAVLQAAVMADEIRDGVRQLLEPPPEGKGRLEQLLEAMEGMLDRLDRIEAKMDALSARAASTISAPPGSLPRTPPKPISGSGG